jgi:hypothetical protein
MMVLSIVLLPDLLLILCFQLLKVLLSMEEDHQGLLLLKQREILITTVSLRVKKTTTTKITEVMMKVEMIILHLTLLEVNRVRVTDNLLHLKKTREIPHKEVIPTNILMTIEDMKHLKGQGSQRDLNPSGVIE